MTDKAKMGKLDLFPGSKILIFTPGDGTAAMTVEAWGGPPEELLLIPGQPMPAMPTPPGAYRIWGVEQHHTTQKWPFSRIPWGARLRPSPHDKRDVLWEVRPGHWASVRQTVGPSAFGNFTPRSYVVAMERRMFKSPSLDIPPYWHLNDFGPTAVRYYVDKNRNHQRDANEPLEGSMFHTTPPNEAEEAAYRQQHPSSSGAPPVHLFESHGCIHLAPTQLQNLIRRGAFIRGTPLIIHKYSESVNR